MPDLQGLGCLVGRMQDIATLGGQEQGTEMLTEQPADSLLLKLCVELGFCLPLDSQGRLVNDPPVDSGGFVGEVFVAEELGLNSTDRHLYIQARAMVAEAFRRSGEEREHGDSRE